VLVLIPLLPFQWHLRTCLKLGNMNTPSSNRTTDLRNKLNDACSRRDTGMALKLLLNKNANTDRRVTLEKYSTRGCERAIQWHSLCASTVSEPCSILDTRTATLMRTRNRVIDTAGQDGNGHSAHQGREAMERQRWNFTAWHCHDSPVTIWRITLQWDHSTNQIQFYWSHTHG
jgi:hypothetical protein